MRYCEWRVAPPLDAWVECVWFLTSARNERPGADGHDNSATVGAGLQAGPPAQRILPDGCIELVCHFGERFLEISRGGLRSPQPACLLVGALTKPLIVQPAGAADTMGVRFRPGCASRFVRHPLAALTDGVVRLDELWGSAATALWEQLAATPDETSRVSRISKALLERIDCAVPDRVTASAVGDLVRSAGRASVEAVAARAGVTTRHLQRRFGEQVGVSPKVLARILRFQNTLRARAPRPGERTDWVRVAVACGYADQSHLIHDYAAFAGETPASLLASEGELSSYFTSPQRLAALFDGRRYG